MICEICKTTQEKVITTKIEKAIDEYQDKTGHVPNVVFISDEEHRQLYNELHPQHRFTSKAFAELGAHALMIKSVPVAAKKFKNTFVTLE